MKKIIITLIILLLSLVACSQSPSEGSIQTAIAETQAAQPTNTLALLATATSTFPPAPTNTPRPTNTPAPTKEPTQTPTQTQAVDTSKAIAKNYVISQESNGVIVEIARILIADKTGVPQDFSNAPLIANSPTVVEYIFRIVNNTDKVITTNFASSAIAAVNGEQIVFDEYWLNNNTWFGDDLSSNILPGSTIIGGLWTGVNRSSWDDVEKIIISVPYFFDNDYSRVSQEFLFNIDIVDWTFEELPEEITK